MPSAAEYAAKIEIEQHWLPKLAPHLPLPIPKPLAMGMPSNEYPWNWSIYEWIDGECAATNPITDLPLFARTLAQFLNALHQIDPTDGPTPGAHNFFRGGPLATYDAQTREALTVLENIINVTAATKLWDDALASSWQKAPVWVHGDLSVGNLLTQNGNLSAVIDFGGMAVGDPACDLAIAWTLFNGESRKAFKTQLTLDADTWTRGRGWALWKSLIIAAGLTGGNTFTPAQAIEIINDLLEDHCLSKV